MKKTTKKSLINQGAGEAILLGIMMLIVSIYSMVAAEPSILTIFLLLLAVAIMVFGIVLCIKWRSTPIAITLLVLDGIGFALMMVFMIVGLSMGATPGALDFITIIAGIFSIVMIIMGIRKKDETPHNPYGTPPPSQRPW